MANFLKMIGRGIGGTLAAGARGSSGGLLRQDDRRDRRMGQGAFLSDIGQLIASRGRQPGNNVKNLVASQQFQAQQQQQQLQLQAAEEEERRQEQLQAQGQQILQTKGPAAFRDFQLGQGNAPLANAAGNAIPETPEAVDDFRKRYQVVGGSLWDKQQNGWVEPPKTSKLMNVDGVPRWIGGTGGVTELDGTTPYEGKVGSVSPLSANSDAVALQAFIAQNGGDATAGAMALEKFKAGQRGGSGGGSGGGVNDLKKFEIAAGKAMAKSVMDGTMLITSLSRQRLGTAANAALMGTLAMDGFDVAARMNEENALKAFYRTMNSTSVTNVRQAVEQTKASGPLIKKLSAKLDEALKKGGHPERGASIRLNAANLLLAAEGFYGEELVGDAGLLKEQVLIFNVEAAKVLKGGASPTNEDVERQIEVFNKDWSDMNMARATDQISENMDFRLTIINELGPVMPQRNPWISGDSGAVDWERKPDGSYGLK